MCILWFVTLVSLFLFFFFIKNQPFPTHHFQIYTYARQRNTKREKNGVLRRKAIAGKNLYRRIREPIPRILTPSPGLYSQGIKSYKGIEIARLYFNITTRNKQIYRHQKFHLLRPSTISADTHQGPIKAPYGPTDSSFGPNGSTLHSSKPQT